MGRLSGKTAIITGAASGMGAAAARRFVEEGANVLVTDINEAGAAEVAGEIGAQHCRHDVTKAEDWQVAVDKALGSYGQIDILVNNAGLPGAPESWEAASVEGMQALLDLNLIAHFHGVKAVTPHMEKAGGGSIVIMSSIAGIICFPNLHPGYGASKAANRLLSKGAAVDFAARNTG